MAQNDNILFRLEHVSKLYGPNRAAAARMMEYGADKDGVYRKTGCTVALWDVCPARASPPPCAASTG